MVDLNSAIDDHHKAPKLNTPANPPDLFLSEPDYLSSFSGSFLDFDAIEHWFRIDTDTVPMPSNDETVGEAVDNQTPDGFAAANKNEAELSKKIKSLSVPIEEDMRKVSLVGRTDVGATVLDENGGTEGEKVEFLSVPMDEGMVKVGLVSNTDVGAVVLEGNGGKEEDFSESIEGSGDEVKLEENDHLGDEETKETVSKESSSDSSVSDSESDDSSSSSSSEEDDSDDGSDEEVEVEEGEKMDDVEEGEIRDVNKDNERIDSDVEEEGTIRDGPVKSKNELEVLQPVPRVDALLEQHHQTVPVGNILSIIGTKVIVEGLAKHNPLNEGSILWITENRLPLGIVDEIFGPVKNPYYVVRYNSEEEVPAGISEGTEISFVMEFATHILNEQSLYKKGYDASGENDEEVSDEYEFSDDEQEAEYKRAQRMLKREQDVQKRGNKEFKGRKKVQTKGRFQKNARPETPSTPMCAAQPAMAGEGAPLISSQIPMHPAIPPRSHVTQPTNGVGSLRQSFLPFNPVWQSGMQPQQLQMGLPGGFQMGGSPIYPNPMFMGFPNEMPQLQFDPSLMQSGQLNIYGGPSPMQWAGIMGPGVSGQLPLGMGYQGQGHNVNTSIDSTVFQGGVTAQQQFNPGTSGRGRKPFNRSRGGRHSGGRGGRQSSR